MAVAVHFPAEFVPEVVERSYHVSETALKDDFSQFNAIRRQSGEVKINIATGQIFHPHMLQKPDFLGFEFSKMKTERLICVRSSFSLKRVECAFSGIRRQDI